MVRFSTTNFWLSSMAAGKIESWVGAEIIGCFAAAQTHDDNNYWWWEGPPLSNQSLTYTTPLKLELGILGTYCYSVSQTFPALGWCKKLVDFCVHKYVQYLVHPICAPHHCCRCQKCPQIFDFASTLPLHHNIGKPLDVVIGTFPMTLLLQHTLNTRIIFLYSVIVTCVCAGKPSWIGV